jgi:lipopolysaccharide transport system permease protein
MLNPLIMTGIYTLVFQFILKINIPNYAAFLLCALLPYNWFSESIMVGLSCIIERPGYVRDAIFPTAVLPVTSSAFGMMNYVFAIPILIIVLLVFKISLGWYLLALPIIMAVQFLFILGIVFFLATFHIFFRDLRFIVQNFLMALYFITPIMYDTKFVPDWLQFVFSYNPLTQILYCYRSIFLYSAWPSWDRLGWVLGLSLILVFLGAWVFENNRESFAEYL